MASEWHTISFLGTFILICLQFHVLGSPILYMFANLGKQPMETLTWIHFSSRSLKPAREPVALSTLPFLAPPGIATHYAPVGAFLNSPVPDQSVLS